MRIKRRLLLLEKKTNACFLHQIEQDDVSILQCPGHISVAVRECLSLFCFETCKLLLTVSYIISAYIADYYFLVRWCSYYDDDHTAVSCVI